MKSANTPIYSTSVEYYAIDRCIVTDPETSEERAYMLIKAVKYVSGELDTINYYPVKAGDDVSTCQTWWRWYNSREALAEWKEHLD